MAERGHITKERLAAFSDGVIAIIITIMVLELKSPHGTTIAALRPLAPGLLSYALSFVFVAIYWNNHHHMLAAAKKINGAVLWANAHLLFWLSLVPMMTVWLGEHPEAPAPAAVYAVILFLDAMAYTVLQRTLVAAQGPGSLLEKAIGDDGKGKISLALYASAIPAAYLRPWIADTIFVAIALIWLVPDRRIERTLSQHRRHRPVKKRRSPPQSKAE